MASLFMLVSLPAVAQTLPEVWISRASKSVIDEEAIASFFITRRNAGAAQPLEVSIAVTETGSAIVSDNNDLTMRTITIPAGRFRHFIYIPTRKINTDSTITVSILMMSNDYTIDPFMGESSVTVKNDPPAIVTDTVTDNDTPDTTAPTVVSIMRQNPTTSPTNADSLTWRVTFPEVVENVDATDFTVTGTTATATVAAVSGQTGVYDVTASGGNLATLNTTVTLSFASGQDIADEADNALTNTTPTMTNDNSFVVDNTGPTVTSITRQDPTTSPTNADSLTWRVTFPEVVENVDATDFTVTGTTATATVAAVSGQTGVYDVTASGGNLATLNTTVTLSFASGQDIADEADNALTNTTPTMTNDNSFVVDNTGPTVTSITRQDPTTSPTNADSLTWRVTFSEVVENVDATDFTVTGTTAMVSVAEVSGEPGVWDVMVSGGNLNTLDGIVTLGFAIGQNIANVGGNALSVTASTGANDNSYVLENTAQDVSTEQLSLRPLEAYLPRFGRTVGEQTAAAALNRISVDRSAGFQGQVAGRSIGLRESGDAGQSGARDRAVFLTLLERGTDAISPLPTTSPSSWLLTSEEVLLGTSFAFMRDTDAGMSLGFWGQASQSGFDGHSVVGDIDGRVTGVQLGADWRQGASIFGLMVSRSRGSGDVVGTTTAEAGEMKSDLTALVPYGGVEVSSTLSFWGAAGLGRGDVTFTPTAGGSTRTDINWSMLAGGARGALGDADALGGASLDWSADALWTDTRSDALPGSPASATSGQTTRVRAGVEASWAQVLDSGSIQTPRLSLGLRHDGGDAETGMGLEIGGGFDWRDASGVLSFGVEGRALALHDDGDFRDWGVGLTFSYDPRPDTQRGFSMVFSQGLDVTTSGGVKSLVSSGSFPTGFDSSDGDSRWSVEASHGTSRGLGMVSSPYVRLSGGGTDQMRDLRFGYRVGPDASRASHMNLDVWAKPVTHAGQPVEVGASLRWNW